MSRQRGSLGPFRDPPVISLGCFGEEAKDEYSGSSQIRFPFSEETGRNSTRCYFLLELRFRNTAERRRILRRSFDARTYRPSGCETWKFIIPRGRHVSGDVY